MPRNRSEKDPHRDKLLAWAAAMQECLDLDPSRLTLEEYERAFERRSEIYFSLPHSAVFPHSQKGPHASGIIKSIYDTYGKRNAA